MVTKSPGGSNFPQQHRQHGEKRKKNCLASLPVNDVTSWLCLLLSMCLCMWVCMCGGPINWKRRKAEKGLALPSYFFFHLFFPPCHPVSGAASPLIPPALWWRSWENNPSSSAAYRTQGAEWSHKLFWMLGSPRDSFFFCEVSITCHLNSWPYKDIVVELGAYP